LIEEAILADPLGAGLRQEGPGGTIIDLSGYDEFGLLVAFRVLPGAVEFVALAIWG
jgi:hypothetical protein